MTEEKNQEFLSNIREKLPGAVLNIKAAPPPEHEVPQALPSIPNEVLTIFPKASDDEKIQIFSEKLSFSSESIGEFEKATRSQAKVLCGRIKERGV